MTTDFLPLTVQSSRSRQTPADAENRALEKPCYVRKKNIKRNDASRWKPWCLKFNFSQSYIRYFNSKKIESCHQRRNIVQ